MKDLTQLLKAAEQGDPKATGELLPLVYSELHKLAVARMAHEALGHTLQATALVQEAWLRIAGSNATVWEGRRHFFAAAAAERLSIGNTAKPSAMVNQLPTKLVHRKSLSEPPSYFAVRRRAPVRGSFVRSTVPVGRGRSAPAFGGVAMRS